MRMTLEPRPSAGRLAARRRRRSTPERGRQSLGSVRPARPFEKLTHLPGILFPSKAACGLRGGLTHALTQGRIRRKPADPFRKARDIRRVFEHEAILAV